MNKTPKDETPKALFFSFPFWLITDPESDLETINTKWNGHKIILYPPFRSGQMAFNGTPAIDPLMLPPDSISDEMRKELSQNNHHLCKYPNLISKMQNSGGSRGRWIPYTFALGKGGGSIYGKDWASSKEDYKESGFPMDSLRVDVLEMSGANRFIAESFVEQLLTRLRLKCKQWWILRNISPLQGFLRGGVHLDSSTHEMTSETFGTIPFKQNFFGFEKPINASIWRDVANDDSSLDFATPRLLLLDAAWHAQSKELYQVPINLCVALEMAIENHLTMPFFNKSIDRPKRSKILKSSGLPGYLDFDCNRILGRSLKDDQPDVFEVIKDLWEIRGQVAHGITPVINRDDKQYKFSWNEAGRCFKAAEATLNWLDTLNY